MEPYLESLGSHLFLVFGLLALGGAATMVFAKSAVHSVVGFLFCMLALASCYLCLGAEFVATAQILVYAGGIVVLFLFVVMMVELSQYKEKTRFQVQAPWAVGMVVLGAAAFLRVFWQTLFSPSAPQALTLDPTLAQGLDVTQQNAQAISRGLYADYLLPFEILSVILLVALVAAVAIAKQERA
jgi:NADH-quinone oxidoreductase subunit J